MDTGSIGTSESGPTEEASVAVVGGGPAGLMAAETLGAAGFAVDLFDAMPSVGRKFLMAGRGGLNLTHNEPIAQFIGRYGAAAPWVAPMIDAFGPAQIRAWSDTLGIATFVGSSGRVFPAAMKAAPLLRQWLRRLKRLGVRFHVRHRLESWRQAGERVELSFATPEATRRLYYTAVIFSLGGGSWAKLGSDGRWMEAFAQQGVHLNPLKPANCGFDCDWSPYLKQHFAGTALKTVAASWISGVSTSAMRQGEMMVTENGIEGGLVYAASAELRQQIEAKGSATLWLDLLPDHSNEAVKKAISDPRGARSLSGHLKSRLGISGLKAALIYECLPPAELKQMETLAQRLKRLPLELKRCRPLDEAISTAGGIDLSTLTPALMLTQFPGIFCAGEMLDWEAPTGGYLLTACLATGHRAGHGAASYLREREGLVTSA